MILVGELRDLETISIAVTAAEMGILVMGTLHTNGAAQTVDRIINVFPADKQSHVRTMLSTSLRGVISQQLLQKADKQGRVAALEIMVNNSAVVQPDPAGQARPAGEHHAVRRRQSGMRTMDSSIQALLDQRIDLRQRGLQEGHQQGALRGREGSGLTEHRTDSRHQRPALRQWPAASGPHPRGRADRHLVPVPAPARATTASTSAPRTAHGTPIMIRARQDGITPEALIAASAAEHQRDYAGFAIAFDHFHSTHREENRRYCERAVRQR